MVEAGMATATAPESADESATAAVGSGLGNRTISGAKRIPFGTPGPHADEHGLRLLRAPPADEHERGERQPTPSTRNVNTNVIMLMMAITAMRRFSAGWLLPSTRSSDANRVITEYTAGRIERNAE